MSVLVNHKLIGGIRLVPLLWDATGGGIAGVSTFDVTPINPPIEGHMLVVALGGAQTRVLTPPSGWTVINHGVLTCNFCYKVATASEPSFYTFTLGGNLSGGFQYYEFQNIDTLSPVQSSYNDAPAGPVTTATPAVSGYDVNQPSVGIAQLSKSPAATWSLDNGYTDNITTGGFSVGRKIFSIPALSQNVNFSGTSTSVVAGLVILKGKLIN